MSRISTDNNSIKICGENFAYIFRISLFTLPLAVLFLIGCINLALYEPLTWHTPIYWLMIMAAGAWIILLPIQCRHAYNTCVTIDRTTQTVTVHKRKNTKNHILGEFIKILIQPIRTPRSGLQYHAYLIGKNGKCHLEITSGSKTKSIEKVKVISEFLEIKIEEATNIGSYEEAFNR